MNTPSLDRSRLTLVRRALLALAVLGLTALSVVRFLRGEFDAPASEGAAAATATEPGGPLEVRGSAQNSAAGAGEEFVAPPAPTVLAPAPSAPAPGARTMVASSEAKRATVASAPQAAAPTPATEDSSAELQMDKEAIRAAVQAVLPRVRACFEDALRRDPSLGGKVVVSLDIEAQAQMGRVLSGEVLDSSETRSPFFEACVLERVAGADFRAPHGEGRMQVNYPFIFKAKRGPGGTAGGEGQGDPPAGEGARP